MNCDELPVRGPEVTFPTSSARGVSIDAPLRVRYAPEGYFGPTGWGGDPTTMIEVYRCSAGCGFGCADGGGEFVPGRVQLIDDELVFLPEGGRWDTAATYSGIARGRDVDLPFSFCTGSSTDETPPVLGPLAQLTSHPKEPDCSAPDGGFRIGVHFDPATDTGPGGSVEYLLFQTRGEGLEGPVLRTRARNFATTGQITMAFTLAPDEATSPICVRVAAVDGVGNVDFDDSPGEAGLCTDPLRGNYFYGLCSASPADAPAGPALLVGLALLALSRRRG